MSKNRSKSDRRKNDSRRKQEDDRQSPYDSSDYDFGGPVEPSEWEKLWRGTPSILEKIDPAEEFHKFAKAKSDPKLESPLDKDYGDSFIVEASLVPSSRPDKPKKVKHSTPKSRSMPDDGYEGFIPSRQPIVAIPPLPPPEPLRSSAFHVAANPVVPDTTDDEDEIKNLAFRIAEDYAKRENIVLVGGALYAYNGAFYSLLSDNDVQKEVLRRYRQELGQANTYSVLRNVSGLLRLCVTREYEEFPANTNIIVFKNGTLETDTGRFRKNSPGDLASSALGIYYDTKQKEMPWTEYFLKTIADGDDDLYELMLQVVGYILSNDVKAKSFFYLEGVGDAGKSRFCDLIASFFPASGTNKVARIALQDLGGKFALGNLVNAKLNISEDLPDSPLSPTTVSRIKMISDANRLEAEAKYVQAFSFRPLCKLLFASNHPLRLKEYDAAFVNRVVYIPFSNPIPKDKQDKDILEKMQGELPALFNHAFAAYRRLVANGYAWAGAERFKPKISISSSSTSIDKEQILTSFVNSCCVLDKDVTTPTADLQAAYNQFCHEHTYLPIQGDRFSRELAAVLPGVVTRVKIGNLRRGFKGIRLKRPTRPSEFDNLDDDFD